LRSRDISPNLRLSVNATTISTVLHNILSTNAKGCFGDISSKRTEIVGTIRGKSIVKLIKDTEKSVWSLSRLKISSFPRCLHPKCRTFPRILQRYIFSSMNVSNNFESLHFHFHQSHLNQIHIWHELTWNHFHIHHFNPFQFLQQYCVSRLLQLTLVYASGLLTAILVQNLIDDSNWKDWVLQLISDKFSGWVRSSVFVRLHCQSFKIRRKINNLWLRWSSKWNISSNWRSIIRFHEISPIFGKCWRVRNWESTWEND
jgi:hypothetical protein